MNEYYLRTLGKEELGDLVQPVLEKAGLWNEEYAKSRQEWYLDTLLLIRDRFHTLNDFAEAGRAYFSDEYAIDPKPLAKNITKYPELAKWLPQLGERFSQLAVFDVETTEQTCRAMAEELGIKPGTLINGMRTVLTGQLAGPSMFDILVTLGQKTVIKRLSRIDHLFAP